MLAAHELCHWLGDWQMAGLQEGGFLGRKDGCWELTLGRQGKGHEVKRGDGGGPCHPWGISLEVKASYRACVTIH